MIGEKELEQLEALAKEATPGRWDAGYGNGITGGRTAAACSWDATDVKSYPIRKGKEVVAWVAAFEPCPLEQKKMECDARFIAAANPAVILSLIEMLRAKEASHV